MHFLIQAADPTRWFPNSLPSVTSVRCLSGFSEVWHHWGDAGQIANTEDDGEHRVHSNDRPVNTMEGVQDTMCIPFTTGYRSLSVTGSFMSIRGLMK